MGSVFSNLFGGGAAPEIEASDPITPPSTSATVEPVSAAARKLEQQRLKAKRAMAGTLLTGSAKAEKESLL